MAGARRVVCVGRCHGFLGASWLSRRQMGDQLWERCHIDRAWRTGARGFRGGTAQFQPLHLVSPPLTLFTLSVFSKMTFGALCGFEYVAIFAGECRNPERN